MKTTWVFLILLVAACSAGEAPLNDEACVDPSKKDPNGVCTMEYKPVCGCNGKTYDNACAAKKDGVLSWTEGACDCIDESKIPKEPTACTEQYQPVCGCNGVTYANSCFAGIAGVTSWTEGACVCVDESKISQGPCTLEYAPVCGCNNVTYGNTCEAQRAGVTSWTAGACPR